ncbi:hypothetical protein SAMN04515665_114123 [Blastococcus sp. DSM 46786]|uniref:hypothetical protein n=1 Tax=Blastococcus sp. DSM 46786 TaxID=1798227 RepID=UPI0008D2A81A|nr:hypothetical protein [Blastococcus sp. DSM 46786]SEL56151.1 hypothetical protein SAMN04515665_114123 [Blastococcus sp. DSM 46786]
MNAWLLRAPWWQVGIVMGALLAPFSVLVFRLAGDRSWTAAVLMGVGVMVVCAPVLGFVTATTIRDSMAAVEEVPEHQRAAVERAARRGPVPEDDALREAALHLVEDRLLTIYATRTRALALPAVLALVTGFLAVAQSPWWWVGVAVAAALAVLVLVAPRRLERRAELLHGAG